ncbi:hypothetical protein Landi51_09378 [Colletotrichum acutatum]
MGAQIAVRVQVLLSPSLWSRIEVPEIVAKVRQKKCCGDAFFGVEWKFRGSSVAEDLGGSNAPTVAQLRRCTSATQRQPRDDIRAQSSRSSLHWHHAPTHHTHQREARPHTTHRIARQLSLSLSVRLGGKGKKRLSRFSALVSDPVQTPSRPNLLQSSPQSLQVRAHLVTSEALSQDDPSSAGPGCLRCLSKFSFLFLIVVWLQVVTREAILDVALIHAHA